MFLLVSVILFTEGGRVCLLGGLPTLEGGLGVLPTEDSPGSDI